MTRLYVGPGRILNWLKAKSRSRFKAGGGSFGGGGATGGWDWWPEPAAKQKPAYGFATFGDPTCPESGSRHYWAYADFGTKIFGPHPSGHNFPYLGVTSIATATWNGSLGPNLVVSEWEESINGVMSGVPIQLYVTVLGHVDVPHDGDYGQELPDAALESIGRIWREDVADSGLPTVVGPNRKFPVYYRTFWECKSEVCTPQFTGAYIVDPFDRWAKRSYPYDPRDVGDPKKDPRDREPNKDDEGFLPPFVFMVPLFPVVAPLPPVPAVLPRPVPRAPEKPGTRARKKGGTLRTIFRVLDVVSETAEVVDCFFDALPKPIKNRWSKGRENRGLIDTAGQYGIDGADWKGVAIWHNWKSVDIQKALTCAAVNQVADEFVGALQRKLPKGAGTAIGRNFSRTSYVAKKQKEAQKWAAIRRANAAKVAKFKAARKVRRR